jgi:cation diffusion facilitator family transporter
VSQNRLKRSLRATLIGLIANVALAGSKLVAGILGHSHALIADAVESIADVFSALIVWRGLVVAHEPADEDHPYGHGKAEPLAAAFVAVMLLVAAAWIVVKALSEIVTPHLAPAPFTLVVLIVVVVIKEMLFRFVLHEAHEMDSSAVHTDAWHHRSDAITSAAAGIGITIALLGGKGFESADDWAAIAAACVIVLNGSRLLRAAVNELMDKSPGQELVADVRRVASAIPGVDAVEKCFVRKMGYHYYVDMHIEVDPQMTVERSHKIAHDVKDQLRAKLPSVHDVLVHIEPTGHRDAGTSAQL